MPKAPDATPKKIFTPIRRNEPHKLAFEFNDEAGKRHECEVEFEFIDGKISVKNIVQ